MKNNNYTSFFKTKPKKVERYIRCRKCGGNMEWVEYYPPEIKCPKCGYGYREYPTPEELQENQQRKIYPDEPKGFLWIPA